MSASTEYLRDALADLTRAERHALVRAAVEARDLRAATDDLRVAYVWAALAAFAAEVDDDERRTLDDLERRLA